MAEYVQAYLCLSCGCIHGWADHPNVVKVKRHIRYSQEDVWFCPRCGKEHRTFDGSFFGQSSKMWEEVDAANPTRIEFVEQGPDMRPIKVITTPDGRKRRFAHW